MTASGHRLLAAGGQILLAAHIREVTRDVPHSRWSDDELI
jgi:hypothetical protein